MTARRPLSAAGRWVTIFLWISSSFAVLGAIAFLIVDAHRETSEHGGTVLSSVGFTVLGLLLALSFLPGIATVKQQRFGRAAAVVLAELILAVLLATSYIVTLHDDCGALTDCAGHQPLRFIAGAGQTVFTFCILFTLAAFLLTVGVFAYRSFTDPEI